jgi:hypothetical protein
LNKYFNKYLGHRYLSIKTICDLLFNFNIFILVFGSSREDDAKKAKLKSYFKNCFYQYQDCENTIKHNKFIQEQIDTLDYQDLDDEVEDKKSDVELYQRGPRELDLDSELTKYLI